MYTSHPTLARTSELEGNPSPTILRHHVPADAGQKPTTVAGKLLAIESLGVHGTWKLGQPCTAQLGLSDSLRTQVATLEVSTLDGNGVEVVYRNAAAADASQPMSVPIKIGRRPSMLRAVVRSADGQPLASDELAISETDGLEATQPLVFAIGSSMGLDQLVRAQLSGTHSNFTIVEVQQASHLPASWLDYSACDLLVIAAASTSLLAEIQVSQWQAIDQWIRRGGGCLISLGGEIEWWQSDHPLNRFLPGPIVDKAEIRDPAALESLVSTDQPLQRLDALLVDCQRGQVQVALTDSLARRVPWWITSTHGLGSINVVASDLDHPSLAQWKHRRLLWERLIANNFERSVWDTAESNTATTGDTAFLGYSDITGQLRSTLERFSAVRTVSFSMIAALLIGITILLGPLDYLISVRWLKRPQFSWFLAAFVLLGSCGGLVAYYQRLRPGRMLINTVRIVDVDADSGRVDGHLWSHIYSDHARRIHVRAKSNWLGGDVHLDWQGLPGTGLGGLHSQYTLDRGLPAYVVDHRAGGAEIRDLALPAAGTKSLYAAWASQLAPGGQSTLSQLASVDQLQGRVVNPLDVELRDVSLFYHRWYYPLASRMGPGGTVTISANVVPRDLSRRLNRQQELDGKLTSARWNPAGRDQLDRLMELMMFYRAASGRNYVLLTHRYQPIVDHSHLLRADSDRAVLVGRLSSAPVELNVKAAEDTDQTEALQDIDQTWCRLVIPVANVRTSHSK
ncbi:MAG: hypothetical protein KF752_15210 [Pirellulaceae bacterium]|nr:hypothetical protein [Pirellulaceae bacterium]